MAPQRPDPDQPSPGDSQSAKPARDEELEKLRALLLLPEQAQIRELRDRLDDPAGRAAELAGQLPDAVRRARKQDDGLAVALTPLIERGLAETVRRSPQTVVDVIVPVLGPAIRRAVAQAVRGMVESLNRVIENSFTPQGLKWRIEAWRTGRSVAEVALKHSLVYRVDHVFLIHRETGLPLYSVGSEETGATDEALMSGMLTAIQDFVRDSFRVDDTQGLDRLEVGDFQIWIERGRHALIAAAIRGEPPRALRSKLSDAVDEVHASMGPRLERFTGDTGPFELTRPILETCLESEFAGKRGVSPVTYVAIAAVLIGCVAWLWLGFREARRWNGYVAQLDAEPGIVVLESGRRAGRRYVSLLRDDAAAEPRDVALAAAFDLDAVSVETEPYVSLEPDMTLRRALRRLEPPSGVALTAEAGVLRARGAAPLEWVRRFVEQGGSLPGVDRIEADELLRASLRQLESEPIRFAVGSAAIDPAERPAVERLAEALLDAVAAAAALGHDPRVEIVGSADASGTPQANRRISQARGASLRDALIAFGVAPSRLSVRAPAAADSNARVARIAVILEGEPAP